jgi:hypothetical protein
MRAATHTAVSIECPNAVRMATACRGRPQDTKPASDRAKAVSRKARRSRAAGTIASAAAVRTASAAESRVGRGPSRKAWIVAQTTRCSPANTRQVPRQPRDASSQVVSGQKIVDEKPESSSRVLTGRRASSPVRSATAETAAWVKASGVAAPITTQTSRYDQSPWARERPARASASKSEPATSGACAPRRSIRRPANGATAAATRSMTVTPPNTASSDKPRSALSEGARMAGT